MLMYRKILVTSNGEYLNELVENTLNIANEEDVEVIGLYVADNSAPFLTPKKVKEMIVEELKKKGEEVLKYMEERFNSFSEYKIDFRSILMEGDPASEIVNVAEEEDVDIIVMGTGKSNIDKHLLGSVSEKVVHASPCTILLVKQEN